MNGLPPACRACLVRNSLARCFFREGGEPPLPSSALSRRPSFPRNFPSRLTLWIPFGFPRRAAAVAMCEATCAPNSTYPSPLPRCAAPSRCSVASCGLSAHYAWLSLSAVSLGVLRSRPQFSPFPTTVSVSFIPPSFPLLHSIFMA